MYFSFFKRNIVSRNLLVGSTDIHTHLLPGVDDGIKNLMDSFATLELMLRIGIKRIYITPHVMYELPDNTSEMLTKRFRLLNDICPSGLELKLAAEYMLDTGFKSRMKEGLLTFRDRHVLVETSYLSPPPGLSNILYEVELEGYIPVLAHPERYMYMTKDDYRVYREKGYKFQLSLFSLTGVYGRGPRKHAEYLLEHELYDYVGSDLHNMKNYQAGLKKLSLTRIQEKKLSCVIENNNTLW